MKQYETIDWKQFAHNEQLQRKATEGKLTHMRKTLSKAQQLMRNIVAHCKKLEAKVKQQDEANETMSNKLNSAYNTLLKARKILQQRNVTAKKLQQENEILKLSLTQRDTQFFETFQDYEKTKHELNTALHKLEFGDDLSHLQPFAYMQSRSYAPSNSNTLDLDASLKDFFVYKNIASTTAVADNLQ